MNQYRGIVLGTPHSPIGVATTESVSTNQSDHLLVVETVKLSVR